MADFLKFDVSSLLTERDDKPVNSAEPNMSLANLASLAAPQDVLRDYEIEFLTKAFSKFRQSGPFEIAYNGFLYLKFFSETENAFVFLAPDGIADVTECFVYNGERVFREKDVVSLSVKSDPKYKAQLKTARVRVVLPQEHSVPTEAGHENV